MVGVGNGERFVVIILDHHVLRLRGEEHVLQLQVRVGEPDVVEELQRLKQLAVKRKRRMNFAKNVTKKRDGEGPVVVRFEDLVHALSQQGHHHAIVAFELELILTTCQCAHTMLQIAAVTRVVWVLLCNVLHDRGFDLRMTTIARNGAHNLHSGMFVCLQVFHLKCTGKCARAQFLHDLIYCEEGSTHGTLFPNDITLSPQIVSNGVVLLTVVVVGDV